MGHLNLRSNWTDTWWGRGRRTQEEDAPLGGTGGVNTAGWTWGTSRRVQAEKGLEGLLMWRVSQQETDVQQRSNARGKGKGAWVYVHNRLNAPVPPKSTCWILIPHMMVSGGGVFGGDEVMRVEPPWMGLVSTEKEGPERSLTPYSSVGDTARTCHPWTRKWSSQNTKSAGTWTPPSPEQWEINVGYL